MFNKEKFSELLLLARGDKNNKEYAELCGVSRAYVSGYINQSIENPPTPDIIKRLAQKAEGKVTYEELMSAAGHINDDSIIKEAITERNLLVHGLSKKDEKDVEKLLNQTMEYIEEQEGIMLNGEILDENDLLLLKQAIKNGLEIAKISNKKKFTPKKYRKD